MKIIITIIIYSLLIVSCASKLTPPPFEDSNQRFIEKIIKQLDIGKELKDKVRPTDRIVLLSIEQHKPIDKPIIAMIEDQIISSLNQNGYNLHERNPVAIQQMIREGKEKYSLTFNKPAENVSYDTVTGDALDSGINFIETQLSSAEIAIFYRILEIGVLYQENHEDKDYVKREGLVSLHIRIQNVQNGEILHATNITNSTSDIVKKEFVNYLSSFHYTFFPYEYPIQKNKKDDPIQEAPTQKNENESPFQNIFFLFQKNK